jgi:hypothetical protein
MGRGRAIRCPIPAELPEERLKGGRGCPVPRDLQVGFRCTSGSLGTPEEFIEQVSLPVPVGDLLQADPPV